MVDSRPSSTTSLSAKLSIGACLTALRARARARACRGRGEHTFISARTARAQRLRDADGASRCCTATPLPGRSSCTIRSCGSLTRIAPLRSRKLPLPKVRALPADEMTRSHFQPRTPVLARTDGEEEQQEQAQDEEEAAEEDSEGAALARPAARVDPLDELSAFVAKLGRPAKRGREPPARADGDAAEAGEWCLCGPAGLLNADACVPLCPRSLCFVLACAQMRWRSPRRGHRRTGVFPAGARRCSRMRMMRGVQSPVAMQRHDRCE